MFEISPSIGCPVDCVVCPQEKINAAYNAERLMTFATFTTCLDKIPAGTVVSFAGFAEPYLNKRTTDMLMYAVAKGHPVMLYTTCVGMKMEDVEVLRRVKFKILCLHLPDADQNAKIKISPDYLEVVNELAELFPKCELMTMGTIHESLLHLKPRLRKENYFHSRAGNVEHLTQVGRRGSKLECTQNAEQKDNVLLPNGDVVLCCADYGLQHVIGNLLTQDYDEIFAGASYLKIRAAMIDGSDVLCRTCEFAKAVA